MSKTMIKSKTQQVYDILLKAIVTHEMPPNAPFVIDKVSKELGVSHIPVREAVQQLETEGFLVSQPFTGTTVSDINPVSIYEIFKQIEALEITTTQLACQCISPELLDEIRQILVRLDDALDDVDQWSGLNIELHKTIASCSSSPLSQSMLELMLKHWDRLRRYYFEDVFAHRIKIAQKEHWLMFAALEQQDPKEVARVISEHNRASLLAYLRFLKNKPEAETSVFFLSDFLEKEYAK